MKRVGVCVFNRNKKGRPNGRPFKQLLIRFKALQIFR